MNHSGGYTHDHWHELSVTTGKTLTEQPIQTLLIGKRGYRTTAMWVLGKMSVDHWLTCDTGRRDQCDPSCIPQRLFLRWRSPRNQYGQRESIFRSYRQPFRHRVLKPNSYRLVMLMTRVHSLELVSLPASSSQLTSRHARREGKLSLSASAVQRVLQPSVLIPKPSLSLIRSGIYSLVAQAPPARLVMRFLTGTCKSFRAERTLGFTFILIELTWILKADQARDMPPS